MGQSAWRAAAGERRELLAKRDIFGTQLHTTVRGSGRVLPEGYDFIREGCAAAGRSGGAGLRGMIPSENDAPWRAAAAGLGLKGTIPSE